MSLYLQQTRKQPHRTAAFHTLNFKTKRLLERIEASQHGLMSSELDQSERDRAKELVHRSLVKTIYGVWTGECRYIGADERQNHD
jgi:hypothetical protein